MTPSAAPELPAGAGLVFIRLARTAILGHLTGSQSGGSAAWISGNSDGVHSGSATLPPLTAAEAPQFLRAPGASFVTLTINGALRGCIGTLEARQPLFDDIRSNAIAAAFHDPRFPPLTTPEYAAVAVEVSILSAPEPLVFESEADALAQLRPGIDGVIFSTPGHRATYLPQVWDDLPDKANFLNSLKRKAGLPATYWGSDVRLHRYTVTAFPEDHS
jgi:AmmeMemoRadiSam system protein A